MTINISKVPEQPGWTLVLLMILCALGFSGCAVSMAVEQPTLKNLDVLDVGTPRPMVLAEFGRPVQSRMVNHRRVDTFQFVQGYSRGERAGRAFLHGAADIATGGLWEIAATPAEGYFSGADFACEILYDEYDRVFRWRTVSTKRSTEQPVRH